MAETLPLERIDFHPDCQARVRLDEGAVADYANALLDGAAMPAITVFFDGATYWLADGFHRWAAHKKAERPTIACEVVQGGQADAIKHALKANALHGKRREPGDYAKGYDIAVRNGLCEAHDTAAVRAILACSERWARDLTAPARERVERERNARIVEAKAAGESNRKIAEREGLSHVGVQKIAERVGNERQTAESFHQPALTRTPPPQPAPRPAQDHVRTILSGVNQPDSMAWSVMLTHAEDTANAIRSAAHYECPAVMAPKAARVLAMLRDALDLIEESIPA